ncbi:CHASE3 domain-containing protein [Hyalangium versicolor]|uniref:CHASE3 domain-containing protein n=1 Tax=Hyalangium versicolor TaxID=2861190 RepID=UPI001CC99BFB|nr:CHASE3 domain-containing protein [Hyalangium versicolor]
MLRKLTVGQQVAGGYAAVTVIMVLISIVALKANKEFTQSSQGLSHTYQVIAALDSIPATMRMAEMGTRGFVITGQDAYLQPFQEGESTIHQNLDALQKLLEDTPDQLRRLATIIPGLETRLGEMRTVISTRREKGFEPAQQLILNARSQQLVSELRKRVEEMTAIERDNLEQRNKQAAENARFLNALSRFGVIGMLLVMVGAGLYITRGLKRQIGMAVEHVQSSSTELQAAATQQAAGAREQAAATTEVSTTVRELLSTFRQIAGNAQQVSRAADETVGATRTGAQTVDRAREAIETVRRQVDVIVNHMLDLGKRSQEIGGILDIINELAEQTNILAINATIESAGAGDHGRRFAVVAEEIRKLADRVGASTKDVRTLIDEIRAAANTTIMATEDGSKAVLNSTRQFVDVADTFKRIADLTGANLDVARQIELSTQQQTSAVEQVNSAIQQVAVTAKQTEISSSQTLQTSTHLIQLSRQLSTIVDARHSASI